MTAYFCDEYHCSAGSVLFRFEPRLQICILRNRRTGETVLPKGHKDLGETIEQAALRETYEETGWPCEFLPCDILTRVPPPGEQSGNVPRLARAANEAIAVTVRQNDGTGRTLKFVWWFVTRVRMNAERRIGTQMASEYFDPEFVDAEDAPKELTRPGDKDVARRAIELVRTTYNTQNGQPLRGGASS